MSVAQLVTDNLEPITFWLSVIVAALGLAALIAVTRCWHRIQSRYREHWAKLPVALFRFVAVVAAIASRSVRTQLDVPFFQQPWVFTTVLAGLGYMFWEFAGAIGDSKFKQSKEKAAADTQEQLDQLTQDRDDAEQQAHRLNWQLTHLRELVAAKLQRIRKVLPSVAGATRASVARVREGLEPDEQIGVTLEGLASLFRMEAAEARRHNQNFRLGLFVERAGRLELLTAFELATKRHDPFSSYQQYADRYRLDNATNPAHAVRCVVEGRTIIVPDCEADPTFEFFSPQQRNYLRSMVAHPLSNFCEDGITPVRAALLVDTNVSGFFREEDREELESLLTEFVTRIDIEYAIKALTQ